MDSQKVGQLGALSPQEKRALLAQLSARKVQKPKTAPLSLAQERIWFLCQLEPNDPGYNITTAYRLSGSLDPAALEQSFNAIIRRHAILRTNFATNDGQPVQVIAPELTLKLAVQDLTPSPESKQETQIEQLVLQESRQLFDLSHGPLLRTTLLRLAPQEHVLVLTTHRIVFDGQCWPVLISELSAFCQAFSNGRPATFPRLPELPLQYADYAAWQREALKGEASEAQLAYWREQLGGQLRLLNLPIDHPRTAAQSRSALRTFTLPENLSDALRTLGQREGVSLFVLLLAAFQILLHRYTDQEDLLVFTSVAGRNRPELKGLMGLFANLLALRTDLSGDPTFRELLARVRETVAGAYAHQDVPFEQVSELLHIERDQSYASVFQAMFIFWPEPLPPVEWPGVILQPLEVDTKPADFDLLLHVTNTRPEMSGALRYKAGLFETTTIARLIERLQILLADLVAAPDRRLSELLKVQAEQGAVTGAVPILPSQRSYLQAPDRWVNMVEVVELQRHAHPALLERAVQRIMEHHDALRARFVHEGEWRQFIPPLDGTAPFTCVDLSALPGAEQEALIKAALASVQRTLGPLRNALIRVMLFKLGTKRSDYLVLTVHHAVSDNGSLPILLQDLYTAYQQLERSESVQLPPKTSSIKEWAERLEAYVHSAEFEQQLNRDLALYPKQIAPLPIDYAQGRSQNTVASTANVQVSLSAEETSLLLKEFPRVYQAWFIDILLTALAQAITQWSGERWMTLCIVDSGRNMELPDVEGIDLSRTVGCLFVHGLLPLARPETDDPAQALSLIKEQLARFPTYGLPVGVAQQIGHRLVGHIAPAGLRFNYLGQAAPPVLPSWSAQTSSALEDFVPNRRHGDIERNPVLLNCTAVILDGQLRVNWEYSEKVHQRATIDRLANAFIEALRAMVRDYEQRRAKSGAASGLDRVYVAPRTPAEQALASIWAKALGREQVGIHDNFFELGGDSITGIQIISKVNQLGFKINPKKLFENQTVAELARVVESVPALQPGSEFVTGPVPLTPMQRWFFEQQLPDPHHFNQAVLLQVSQGVNPGRLQEAVGHLLGHHDALRLRFERTASGWQQLNAGAGQDIPFTQVDLSALSEREQEIAAERASEELRVSLNLTAGPLLRVALFDLGAQRPGHLLIIAHRLVVDAVSWPILLQDLSSAYQQLCAGEAIHLHPKTTSFKQWAEQLAERTHFVRAREEQGYWLDRSRSEIRPLPIDQTGGVNSLSSTQIVVVALDIQETQALLCEVPKAYQTQTEELLLTTLMETCTQWIGARSLLLELESRERADIFKEMNLSRTVGWLTPVFPIWLDLKVPSPGEALIAIKEQLRRVPNKGVNYGVLRYASTDKELVGELSARPQPQVRFTYLGQLDHLLPESSWLESVIEFSGVHSSPQGMRLYLLEIEGSIVQGRLQLVWRYSRNLHQRSTVERLAQKHMEALRELIAHCQSPDAGAYTPSDFADFRWGDDYFREIAAEIHKVIG